MIVVYHHNRVVTAVEQDGKLIKGDNNRRVPTVLMALARQFPDALIVWCAETLKSAFALEAIPPLFHHRKMIHSYGASYLGAEIGFVEGSPFVNVKKDVPYPTWMMSTDVGGIYADVLNAVNGKINTHSSFEYFLNSLAKLLMPKGLFCYSSPQLLNSSFKIKAKNAASTKVLFRFVKQHYKARWTLFLLLCFVFYKKQLPLLAFVQSLFYKRRSFNINILDAITLKSVKRFETDFTIDVVIPTIGRKPYLYDVLKDLAQQTLLPNQVIMIEQNPDEGSVTELDYLNTETWPFKIKHLFTHQTGACNARNLGLKEVRSRFVFLADDDIRLGISFFKDAAKNIKTMGVDAVTLSCLQKNERQNNLIPVQWWTFGSGCSIVKASKLQGVQFDLSLEHGYGEDADFGMQLRNKGLDVIYVPEPTILHLKAPMGGFRTKPVLPWQQEPIVPKPSPTIMHFHQKHRTNEQILGYKMSLFLIYYKKQSIKNPIKYYNVFQQQWNQSIYWANQLKSNHEI